MFFVVAGSGCFNTAWCVRTQIWPFSPLHPSALEEDSLHLSLFTPQEDDVPTTLLLNVNVSLCLGRLRFYALHNAVLQGSNLTTGFV